MRGFIILTEGRSGSSWLGSLTEAAGTLGHSQEWFTPIKLNPIPAKLTGPDLVAQVIDRASTPNQFFAIKMFPKHLHWFQANYQMDLLHYLVTQHDVLLIKLTRQDRLRQAISYARAIQTQQWDAYDVKAQPERYNFGMICRCYFLIDRSYKYWDSYLDLRGLPSHHLIYEEMAISPQPYLDLIANHAGVARVPVAESKFTVQRDDVTEEWIARFQSDIIDKGIVDFSTPSRPYKNSIKNMLYRWRGKRLRPLPYGY